MGSKFCDAHLEENGAHDDQISSMIPAQPGWRLAAVDKDGTLYVEPVIAWAIVAKHSDCGCIARAIRPLVAGWGVPELVHDHFEVELGDFRKDLDGRGDTFRSTLVPPGHRVTVSKSDATLGPQYALDVVAESSTTEPAR